MQSAKREQPERPLVLRMRGSNVIAGKVRETEYLESIDAGKVYSLLEKGMTAFTGEKNINNAWSKILVNYHKGEKVAIKPNFNFVNQGLKYTITSPQLINAVVRQLVERVGVPPGDISVYDLCKEIPDDVVKSRIEYPVQYVERMDARSLSDKIRLRLRIGPASADRDAGIVMRERIIDSDGAPVACYVPKVVTQAAHLINMPLLTNHPFVISSGALKNHYGTVRFSNYHSYPAVLHGAVMNRAITDINSNHHIRNKTRIIIADGLLGVFDRGEGYGKKTWLSMNKDYPRSIFLSNDPVAMDSVMAGIVARERMVRGLSLSSSGYLADAEKQGLGVHELSHDMRTFSRIRYEERNA